MSNLIPNSNQSNQRQRAGAISCPFLLSNPTTIKHNHHEQHSIHTLSAQRTQGNDQRATRLTHQNGSRELSRHLANPHTENRPERTGILLDWTPLRRDNRTRLRASSEQGDRGLRTLIPHRRFAGARGHRQQQSRPRHDKGNRLAPVPPVPTHRIRPDRKGLHQNLQRQDIPEPQTDIPPRKHSLLAGNQGCVLGAATVKPRIHIKRQGEAPI